jgi:hypothetical protein
MRHPGSGKTSSSLGTAGGALICSLALYLLAAWFFHWWPFPARVLATCPATVVHYQVFVDPTASNKIKAEINDNWKAQARRFADSLDSCDETSFWTITDSTSSSGENGKPLVFPLLDHNASRKDIRPEFRPAPHCKNWYERTGMDGLCSCSRCDTRAISKWSRILAETPNVGSF